jgi:antitoxin YefM
VLVSEEDWKAIQETLHLLSVPGMRESIKEGMAQPLDKSARKLDW